MPWFRLADAAANDADNAALIHCLTTSSPQKHLAMQGIPTTVEGEAAAIQWLKGLLGNVSALVMRHAAHAVTALTMARNAAQGESSGGHAAFAGYGVDAVTVSIEQAPHQHNNKAALGVKWPHQRALASALHGVVRCLNNAVERLHHSSTMYVLLSASRVASIAVYSTATVPLIATAALVAAGAARKVRCSQEWHHGAVLLLGHMSSMGLLTAGLWVMGMLTMLPGAALVVATPAGPAAVALVALGLVGGTSLSTRLAVAGAAAALSAWWRRFRVAMGAQRALYASVLCVVLGGCAVGNWGFGLLVGAAVLPSSLLSS